jgi:hypothetical protein
MKGPNIARKIKRKMIQTPVTALRFWMIPVIQREKMLLWI